MSDKSKFLVVASGVKNPISGRFKVLINWAKGLNSNIFLTNSSFDQVDLETIAKGVNIIQLTKDELIEEINKEDPTYVLIDDRDLEIGHVLKNRKVISYVYPIHGLWGMPGLETKDLVGISEKIKVGLYRNVPHYNLRKKYKRLETESFCVVAQSFTASGILRYYYGINPSLVLYNPVDRSLFRPLNSIEDKISSNEITLFLGSNNGDTDLQLIKETAHLANELGFALNTFGYEKNLHYATSNCENTHYFRRIPDAKLVEIFSRSRFVILPQLDEPASYVGIESISCGTPVISRYADEAIISGVTGYSVNKISFYNVIKNLSIKGIERAVYERTISHSSNFDVVAESKQLNSYLERINNGVDR